MNPIVKLFVTDLKEINEQDYGDFMRKANQHLIEMRNRLHHYHYQDVDHKIDEMQNYVQFYPTWMIESTRNRALHDADEIDHLLQLHQPDQPKPTQSSRESLR